MTTIKESFKIIQKVLDVDKCKNRILIGSRLREHKVIVKASDGICNLHESAGFPGLAGSEQQPIGGYLASDLQKAVGRGFRDLCGSS